MNRFLPLLAAAVLAGCSNDSPDPTAEPDATSAAAASAVLETLQAEDIGGAALAGELR